ncbi:hypothetical protein [Sphingomonas radiodurans]|nr:hypothetical protein [Sphingomonas radiodurans]WBH17848.1 hypothetical protein LLW23_07045 [Sphingomonas radiodurans]
MLHLFHHCFGPLIAMNRRISIGGGVLMLVMGGQAVAMLVSPLG